MKEIKWLDMYELLMNQKKEYEEEIKIARIMYNENKLSSYSFKTRIEVYKLKINTVNETLRRFEKLNFKEG